MTDEFEWSSPRPWAVDQDGCLVGADGAQIGSFMPGSRRAHDAALTKRAVNAFGPMREALRELRASFGQNASEERLNSFTEAGMVLSIHPLTVAKLMRALRAADGEVTP